KHEGAHRMPDHDQRTIESQCRRMALRDRDWLLGGRDDTPERVLESRSCTDSLSHNITVPEAAVSQSRHSAELPSQPTYRIVVPADVDAYDASPTRAFELAEGKALQHETEGMKVLVAVRVGCKHRCRSFPTCIVM